MYVYVRYLEVVHGLKLVKHIVAGLRQCELDGRIEELLQFHIKIICPSNITNPMVAWWLRICSPQLYTTGLFQPALLYVHQGVGMSRNQFRGEPPSTSIIS